MAVYVDKIKKNEAEKVQPKKESKSTKDKKEQ